MIVYLIGGALVVSVLIVTAILSRLTNQVNMLKRELRTSNERLREQIERVTSETKEEREERERKEAERRDRERAEREAREREEGEQASSSYSSTSDDDDYCRCSSPGDACTWK